MRTAHIVALAVFLLSAAQAWGWAEPNFQFRREITINPGSVSNLSGMQVNITFDTQTLIAAGKMQSDCDDIRFYDVNDSVKLPYFIESGCNTKNTLIWVKLSGNYTKIYMYYGNPTAAGESNISVTFELADDFDGSAIDSSKWYEYKEDRVTRTISNSILKLDILSGTGIHYFLLSKHNFTCDNCTLEVKVSDASNWVSGDTHTIILNFESNYTESTTVGENYDHGAYEGYRYMIQDYPRNRLQRADAGVPADIAVDDSTLYQPAGNILFIRKDGNTYTAGINQPDGINIYNLTASDSTYTPPFYAKTVFRASGSSGITYEIDWIRVRRVATIEPTTTLGAEEQSTSVTIELRDEDLNERIQENATIAVYSVPDYTLYGVYKTSNGLAHVVISKMPSMILAWTNKTYTFQRRILIKSLSDIKNNKVTIYLLKDGRGSTNYFNTYSATGVKVPQAEIKIMWGDRVIDHGFSDSNGRFTSYLDPYKVYLVNATKEGYESNVTQFYGTGLTTHTIILVLKPVPETGKVKIRFLPDKERIPRNETAYLWIEVTNWRLVDNITVLVMDDLNWLKLYSKYGITEPGRSEAFFFDLNDTDTSWCNATILCHGDLEKVTWRVMPTPLNDFGSTGRVYVAAYYYTADGKKYSHEAKQWIIKAVTAIQRFLMQLSEEQRMFIGLFLVLLTVGVSSVELNLTFRQSGWVAALVMVVNVVLGLWDRWMIIAPLVVFMCLIAWRETV